MESDMIDSIRSHGPLDRRLIEIRTGLGKSDGLVHHQAE
jgi:hypothetical protein